MAANPEVRSDMREPTRSESDASGLARATPGAELERDRLERRISRTAIAITWLRQYGGERQGDGRVPGRYVRQAITDFEAQIVAMKARLRDLPPKRTAPRLSP
jgi:hypothetical protein